MKYKLDNGPEAGSALIIFFLSLLPLTVLVGAAMTTMSGRTDKLQSEIVRAKALLAAESGVDEAVAMAAKGMLTLNKPVTRKFGTGMSFTVLPVYLKTDGVDNDADGEIDEADEDVIQLTSTGTANRQVRRIVGYLRRDVAQIPDVQSALYLDGVTEIDLGNATTDALASIDGTDTKLDGTRGDSSNDVAGISYNSSATSAEVFAELDSDELPKVKGLGGAPSVHTTGGDLDVADIVRDVKAYADIRLEGDSYVDLWFGDAATGDLKLTYREGDLTLRGTGGGAGILVVTGDLLIEGDIRFDGMVIAGKLLHLKGLVTEEPEIEFFGVPVVTKKAAFCIDVSGSMDADMNFEVKNWERLDEAKRQLGNVVNEFPSDGLLHLIKFASTASSFESQAGVANSDRKDRATSWIGDLDANGGTNIYEALSLAFADKDIDTVFLISDGDPTRGAITNKTALADEVAQWNATRGLTIHTISIGIDSAMMKRFADESAGTYTYIAPGEWSKESSKSAKSGSSKSKSGSSKSKSGSSKSKSGSSKSMKIKSKSGSSKSKSGSSKSKSGSSKSAKSGSGKSTKPTPVPEALKQEPKVFGTVIHMQGDALKMEGPSRIVYSKEAVRLGLTHLYFSSPSKYFFSGWQEVKWR